MPVKVDPLMVATMESLMLSVTAPEAPPPDKPVPAVTSVISPPVLINTIDPLEAEDIEIPLPATR